MDDMTYGGAGYDYRQNQRLWQRVAPSMPPYPESAWPPAAGGGMAGAAGTGMASSAGMTPSGGAVSPSGGAGMAPEAGTVNAGTSAASDAALESLPGAVSAPCCVGSAARDDRALQEGVRRSRVALLSLLTGPNRPETLDCQRIYVGSWCPALRQRYHEEACAGLNYLRAADGTTDPCLQKAYQRLSAESYQQAEWVTGLLEKALGPSCARPGMGV